MEKPKSVRCENCMFYAEATEEGKYLCMFNPPFRLETGVSSWPRVQKNWWCGQFMPKDNLTAIEWVAWKKGLAEDAQVQK